jgi:hypothetical protein
MNASQAGQLSELTFLSKIAAQGIRDVCFVVNMIDGKSPADVQRVIDSLRAKVAGTIPNARIFGVSALYALSARTATRSGVTLSAVRRQVPALRASDAETWGQVEAESGMPVLEKFLSEKLRASTRSGLALRMQLGRIDGLVDAALARLQFAHLGATTSRDEMITTLKELERQQQARESYLDAAERTIRGAFVEMSRDIESAFGETGVLTLKAELAKLIENTSPASWRGEIGSRIEVALLHRVDGLSQQIEARVRAIEPDLRKRVQAAFDEMAGMTPVTVSLGRLLPGGVALTSFSNLAASDNERFAAAASYAGAGAAAFGAVGGLITLASAAIAGPLLPLVAAAIGAMLSLQPAAQSVSAAEIARAKVAAELEIERAFTTARKQATLACSDIEKALKREYVDAITQRHLQLVAECNKAIARNLTSASELEKQAGELLKRVEQLSDARQRIAAVQSKFQAELPSDNSDS